MKPSALPPAAALSEAEAHALKAMVLMQRAREGARGSSASYACMHLDEALRWMLSVRDELKEAQP